MTKNSSKCPSLQTGWCSPTCSSAYVSLEQVSRMWTPRVTPGSKELSVLILSMANSMASNLWMPRSSFTRPHSSIPAPFSCTGNRPPRTRSPSMRISRRDGGGSESKVLWHIIARTRAGMQVTMMGSGRVWGPAERETLSKSETGERRVEVRGQGGGARCTVGLSQAAALGAWVCLWPMKWSGRAELDHTWTGKPFGHWFSFNEKNRQNINHWFWKFIWNYVKQFCFQNNKKAWKTQNLIYIYLYI